MNDRVARMLAVLALLVWSGALVWTGRTLNGLDPWAARAGRWVEDLRALRALESEILAFEARMRVVQADAARPPVELAALLASVLPTARLEDVHERTQPLDAGWEYHETDFALRDVPVAGVMDLIAALEKDRPSWRISGVEWRSSPQAAGRVDAFITLAAIRPGGS